MKLLLLIAIFSLAGCNFPVGADIQTPNFNYTVSYQDYFLGKGADIGVKFDVDLYDCIDGFVYNEGDTTTSIGTCDPDIYTEIKAVQ